MRSIGFALAVLLCGCPGPVPAFDNFEGNWSGNVTDTFSCPGLTQQVETYGDTLTILQSGAAVSVSASDCSFSGTANGDMIVVNSGTCPTQTFSDGSTLTLTISSGTLTLDNSGVLDLSMSGTSSVTDSMGNFADCGTTRIGSFLP